jgi:hypothetical protein
MSRTKPLPQTNIIHREVFVEKICTSYKVKSYSMFKKKFPNVEKNELFSSLGFNKVVDNIIYGTRQTTNEIVKQIFERNNIKSAKLVIINYSAVYFARESKTQHRLVAKRSIQLFFK